MDQEALFEQSGGDYWNKPMRTKRPKQRDHKAEFEKFHQKHPQVYQKLVELARGAKDQGVNRFGISPLYERLRYEMRLLHGGQFKLNNNFRAYYSRLIMAQEPDLNGFFETRGREKK